MTGDSELINLVGKQFVAAYDAMFAKPRDKVLRKKGAEALKAFKLQDSSAANLLGLMRPDHPSQLAKVDLDEKQQFFLKHYKAAHDCLMAALDGDLTYDVLHRMEEMEFCDYKWHVIFPGNSEGEIRFGSPNHHQYDQSKALVASQERLGKFCLEYELTIGGGELIDWNQATATSPYGVSREGNLEREIDERQRSQLEKLPGGRYILDTEYSQPVSTEIYLLEDDEMDEDVESNDEISESTSDASSEVSDSEQDSDDEVSDSANQLEDDIMSEGMESEDELDDYPSVAPLEGGDEQDSEDSESEDAN